MANFWVIKNFFGVKSILEDKCKKSYVAHRVEGEDWIRAFIYILIFYSFAHLQSHRTGKERKIDAAYELASRKIGCNIAPFFNAVFTNSIPQYATFVCKVQSVKSEPAE